MNRSASFAAAIAALACAIALPVSAASSASSASSESLTASSGSVSTSLQGSSGSSTGTGQIAAGDYRIVEVAAAPQRPDAVRLTLQREAAEAPVGDGRLYLTVPRATLAGSGLARGDLLAAAHRPYGLEFSAGTPREPFFLVLDDAWQRDLKTVPVPG